MDENVALLRHTVATLAYRGSKVLRGAPAEFGDYRAGETSRSAGQILAHIGDLLDWALSHAEGRPAWHDSPALAWEQGTARFFAALEALDRRLASPRTRRPPALRRSCFRGRLPMRSRTWARSPCFAAWPAVLCAGRTILKPTSPQAAWALSRPNRSGSLNRRLSCASLDKLP
jgi:hypothetical protein